MENVETLRKSLPIGTRLMLMESMSGESDMRAGLTGTVKGIDDDCNIHMNWDNNRTIPLTVDDHYEVVDSCEDGGLLSLEALDWLKKSGYASASHDSRMEMIKIAKASFGS